MKKSTQKNKNITKRDIVLDIYRKTGIMQQDVREIVQMTLDIITEAIGRGENIELRNFGVFEVQVREARVGRNPNKPEQDVMIPRRAAVKFKPGKELKALLKSIDLDQVN